MNLVRKIVILCCTTQLCFIMGCSAQAKTEEVKKIQAVQDNLSEQNDSLSKEEIIKSIAEVISENFADNDPSVSYDTENEMVNIVIHAPEGMANALIIAPETIKESWGTLCSTLTSMTASGYQMLLENGYKTACTIIVLSDANPENALFAAMNGTEIMNAIK